MARVAQKSGSAGWRARKSEARVFHVRRREDFDLFCSPIRASILEYLLALGPMPAREIAAQIGRSAALTHHHLGILVRGGLIREDRREKRGRHRERIFAIGPMTWKYDFKTHPQAMADGLLRIARTWGRHSDRLLARVFRDNPVISPRMQRIMTFRAETGRLSKSSAEAVREHLHAIRRIFERERRRSDGELHQIFWSYFPLGKSTRDSGAERSEPQERAGKRRATANPRSKGRTRRIAPLRPG